MLRTALGSALATTLAAALLLASSAHAETGPGSQPPGTRGVVVVSNNWDGTADVVDATTYRRLKRLNIIPDKAQREAEIASDPDPRARFYFENIRALVGEGNDQYVDDAFPSKDGRTLYVSRPSFKDVIGLDVKSGTIRWRTRVDGFRSDHMALSPDGRQLLVSASTANVVMRLSTADGKVTGRFASGAAPHENNYTADGKRIIHASIGVPYTSTDEYADDAGKGERFFQVVDARTLKVLRRIDMGERLRRFGIQVSSAVRPIAIAPDERTIYFQLSFLHGFVEYDLVADRPKRIAFLPRTNDLPRTAYTQDSAHHGLTINPEGTKLCVAGTMSNYAAIVPTRTLAAQRIARVGSKPYWSTNSLDGKRCFVSVSGQDRVAVLDYRTGREVARFSVGDHPQRMRTGYLRADALRASG